MTSNKKDKKDKKLSENVRRFIERREREERQAAESAAEKRQQLLALRREDKKSMRAMNSMLQRTKSANRAVIDDARNLEDTADTLAGRRQCDEDDYGYESTAARNFYERFMNKYEKDPVDEGKIFSSGKSKRGTKDLSTTVARVKAALERGDDEEKREKKDSAATSKRKSAEDEDQESKNNRDSQKRSKREVEMKEARQKRLKLARTSAPPASFQDLMRMAQEKQKEPMMPVEKKRVKPEAEFDRPMTQKEKEEFLRERNSQLRKAGKVPRSKGPVPQTPSGKESKGKEAKSPPVQKSPEKKVEQPKKKPVIVGPEFHPAVVKPSSSSSSKSSSTSTKDVKRSNLQRDRSNNGFKRPKARSPSPVASSRSKINAGRVIDSESEEEEDYEMDDFIDDSDANMDISAQIRSIFGYDRRKFRDEPDFDDRYVVGGHLNLISSECFSYRSMENNRFADVMKEEARSARIGRMEDLEDMRREEEEKKRKKMKKKQGYK